MGNAINILDVKLLEIVGTPAKLIDHNFMKGIFQVFIDTVDTRFERVLDLYVCLKQSKLQP